MAQQSSQGLREQQGKEMVRLEVERLMQQQVGARPAAWALCCWWQAGRLIGPASSTM